jgi:hypothetical protein
MCPYEPKQDKTWLENYLKRNFRKKSYSPYHWWRDYRPKKKPLPPQSRTMDKIINGDFDMASYKYEIGLIEHKLCEGWNRYYPDISKFLEVHSIDITRLKRLGEDLEKDEKTKLNHLYKCLMDEFGWDRKECEENLINSNKKTLLSVYKDFRKTLTKV